MDRNQAVGFSLIFAILIAYFFFFVPKEEPQTAQQQQARAKVEQQETDRFAGLSDSARAVQQRAALGAFGAAASGQEQHLTLENENLRIAFTTKGGQVDEVELKNYKTWDKQPLILFDKESSHTDIAFKTTDGKTVKLSDLFFQPSAVSKTTVKEVPAQTITFRAEVGSGQYVEQVYTLFDGLFQLDYRLNFIGLQGAVANQPLTFTWNDQLKKLERDLKQNRAHSTLNFYTTDGTFDYLSASSVDPESEKVEEPVKWVANKQNFFTAAIIAHDKFENGTVKSSVNEQDTTVVKTLQTELAIPAQVAQGAGASFTYFFGPNDYDVLKKVTPEFDRNLELGWGIFAWINKFLIIPIFDLLENSIANYGIIIILLVLFIRLILTPLTYKSYLSMAKMKVLKPEIDAIKEKNNGDMQKTQAETMKLYSQVGVNPMSGCIPMLLQIPILFAMFNFFPNAIELRQEAFLWATDLSTYDVFAMLPFTIPFYGNHVSMFTLLMTASTILYTWSNNQMNTMQGPMKFYSYLMPVIFMFVLNSFPAGLSFYYFVSNMVSFGQQALIRRFVDEDKIKAKLEENREKNKDKKTSSFQQRLQDAMKAASEADAKNKEARRKQKK